MKHKYVKPTARGLNEIAISMGSCVSGSGEKTVKGACTSGGDAYADCTTGSNPLPAVLCLSGGAAGQSCISGSNAG